MIAIAGGSGLLGQLLAARLRSEGHRILTLTRKTGIARMAEQFIVGAGEGASADWTAFFDTTIA